MKEQSTLCVHTVRKSYIPFVLHDRGINLSKN